MQGQKPPSAEESRKIEAVKSLWCLPCALEFWDGVPCTVQHIVECMRRLGHAFIYSACEWHHLGMPPAGYNNAAATSRYGPCLMHDRRAFEQRFGREEILAAIADVAVGHLREAEDNGRVFLPNEYGLIVRNEAQNRLNRGLGFSLGG